MKSTYTVETTAVRSERKHVAAEESVTARIRRRQETQVTEDQTPEATEPTADTESFRERILRERQQNAEGEGQRPS